MPLQLLHYHLHAPMTPDYLQQTMQYTYYNEQSQKGGSFSQLS